MCCFVLDTFTKYCSTIWWLAAGSARWLPSRPRTQLPVPSLNRSTFQTGCAACSYVQRFYDSLTYGGLVLRHYGPTATVPFESLIALTFFEEHSAILSSLENNEAAAPEPPAIAPATAAEQTPSEETVDVNKVIDIARSLCISWISI